MVKEEEVEPVLPPMREKNPYDSYPSSPSKSKPTIRKNNSNLNRDAIFESDSGSPIKARSPIGKGLGISF
jgi:hypothetical protein